MTTTQMMIVRIKEIINSPETPVEGINFNDLWEKLMQDEELAPQMTNLRGEPRSGVLLGIFTRVKNNRIDGLGIYIDDDGKRSICKRLPGITARVELMKRFIKNAHSMGIDPDAKQEDSDWLGRFDSITESMNDLIEYH